MNEETAKQVGVALAQADGAPRNVFELPSDRASRVEAVARLGKDLPDVREYIAAQRHSVDFTRDQRGMYHARQATPAEVEAVRRFEQSATPENLRFAEAALAVYRRETLSARISAIEAEKIPNLGERFQLSEEHEMLVWKAIGTDATPEDRAALLRLDPVYGIETRNLAIQDAVAFVARQQSLAFLKTQRDASLTPGERRAAERKTAEDRARAERERLAERRRRAEEAERKRREVAEYEREQRLRGPTAGARRVL